MDDDDIIKSQIQLSNDLDLLDRDFDNKHFISGVSILKDNQTDVIIGISSGIGFNSLNSIVYEIQKPVSYGYKSGLRSHRVGEVMVQAINELNINPDLIIIRGHGIAHPRKFGLACYVGLKLRTSTIGVAKHNYQMQIRDQNNLKLLYYNNDLRGFIFKSSNQFKPIFVSPGNLISIKSCQTLIPRLEFVNELPWPIGILK